MAKLHDLTPDASNANRGTERGRYALETSLRKYGAGRSILIDRNGRIIAGNKTAETAGEIGLDDVIIVQTDGRQLVAVQRTDLDLDSKEARELAYADNRVSELDLSFSPEQILADLQAGIDLEQFWRKDELDELLADLTPKTTGDTEPQTDRAEELREKWQTAAGQLWQLGEHRLICGDCTDPATVARVMGGEKAQAVVTDPPYGINREGIPNDDPEGLRALFDGCLAAMPITDGVLIAFQSPRLFPVWLDAARAAGQKFERALWMYKSNDETFPWRGWVMSSEIIILSSIGEAEWLDVHPYKHDCYTYNHDEKLGGLEGIHTTVKPTAIIQDLISRVGGIVYEPFSGSGTTIIACENLGRRCRACEISAAYTAVALQRFFDHTGVQPVLLERA